MARRNRRNGAASVDTAERGSGLPVHDSWARLVSEAGIKLTHDPKYGWIVDHNDVMDYLATYNETDRKVFVDLLEGRKRPLDGWYVRDLGMAIHNFHRIQEGRTAQWL